MTKVGHMNSILHFNDVEEDKELSGNLSESKLIWKKAGKGSSNEIELDMVLKYKCQI